MTEKTLSESLKDSGIGVTEISAALGVSRQTVYNYLQYYEDGDIEKMPNVVFRILEMCTQEDMGKEAKEYWKRETRDIANALEKTRVLQEKLNRCENEYRHLLERLDADPSPANPDEVRYQREKYAKELSMIRIELESKEKILADTREYLMRSTANGRESQIQPTRGKRGNPIWKGADIQTVCISDGSEHMVIVKDAESSALAIVEIYALIDDADVLLEKHEVPRGSNIVRISLLPKLNYSYRVIEYTNDGVKTTGMMELKNYFRMQ